MANTTKASFFSDTCNHLMSLNKLTYHASNTIGAEETLTASCTISRSRRNVLCILQVNFLWTRTTSPPRLTSRNPRGQITVLVRFQVIGFLRWCAREETIEVESYFCCCAQSLCEISYWSPKNHHKSMSNLRYHNWEKHHIWNVNGRQKQGNKALLASWIRIIMFFRPYWCYTKLIIFLYN